MTTTSRSGLTTPRAALSGALAAAVAFGITELVSGFGGEEQSLVVTVGDWMVDTFAASLKDLAVSLFGTNDKVALVIGILVVGLGLGALLGIGSRRRPWVAPVGFGAFALLGILAASTDPTASSTLAAVAAVLGAGAGLAALRILERVASADRRDPAPAEPAEPAEPGVPGVPSSGRAVEYPTDRKADRRSFFGWAGAAGAVAVGAGALGRVIAGRTSVEEARRNVALPRVDTGPGTLTPAADAAFDVEGLTPYYVPNEDFYRIDTALVTPQVDPSTWSLRIGGMVDDPIELTFDELLALDMVEEAVTLSCVSNEIGGDLVGNARWQGVPLATLLERAGVQPGATQIVGRSVDGWTAGFPTEVALDGRTALVAVGMNGEPLPVAHGFPARLVIAGLYGYVSATKWLSEITLTTWEAFDGYWIPRGWSKDGPIKTQSRIDVPRSNAELRPGRTPIAGVAWAPSRGISKVEVQVDDGPWVEARIGDAVSDNTWVQWVVDWDAPPGRHDLRVRATDGTGTTQVEQRSRPDPDGATGWHFRRVEVGDG